MLKKLSVGILALLVCLCFTLPVSADEFGFGGAFVDGHSDDGRYGMNNEGAQSFGGVLHYEKDKDWQKTFGNNKIGVDPGMVYMFLRWTKTHNLEKTTCKGYECEKPQYDYPEVNSYKRYETCTTEKYDKNRSINSHILGMYLKPYWEIHKKVRLFGLAGPGLEFADDSTNFVAVVGGGIQYRFSERFATSLTQYEVFSDPTSQYRRFDATVLSIDFLF
jgi:hypothetical protein